MRRSLLLLVLACSPPDSTPTPPPLVVEPTGVRFDVEPAQRTAEPIAPKTTKAIEDGRLVVFSVESPRCDGCEDLDGDGLSDAWEATVLEAFRPAVRMGPDEPFLVDPDAHIFQVGRVYPVSETEVHLLIGVAWHRDYGSTCGGVSAHWGDPERVALAVELRDDGATVLSRAYTAAHEGSLTDFSRLYETADLAELTYGPEPRWMIYASERKHASYANLSACEDASDVPCLREMCGDVVEVLPDFVNAGEPDAPLIDDLEPFGFPGESAWADQRFCGGSGRSPCPGALRNKLVDDPFDVTAPRAVDFEPVEPYNPDGPLCDIAPDYVEQGGDPVNPTCTFAAGAFSDRAPDDVPETLRVVAWNIHKGVDHALVMNALVDHPDLSRADIVLLSEISRRDLESSPQRVDEAAEISKTLQMNYVFGVEWDRREHDDQGGEHGLAILSKYPIGNPHLIRHTQNRDFWAEDKRYGGRASMAADLLIGDRLVRVYSSHFDTRLESTRAVQGSEVRADADLPGTPDIQIVGGDFNTWTCNPIIADCGAPPDAEQVVQDLLSDQWLDGTAGFDGHTHVGAGFFPQRLDWIFVRGARVVPGEGIDVEGSDHLPLFTDFDVAGP